ncbi:hypothetical protein D1818_07030 [Aquimarina sp. BL5]|uniref:hypothetical protein n=1 Tax=Aquimarina sp. BL5 TaxID=1714860 RepID=UPI000E525591|nr:hypothetical protein [Aquimarina sp. BL5]AXT50597.1 hypothetical protein D1818_07030 [Aquimarina sp. BL5]RKM97710.1 hypothetical protein D7036_20390 [Aquimarina sp. BL5]
MKYLIIISILFFSNSNFGQIAVIKDKDGFTNVRKLPDSKSEVIYKLKDSEIFSYQESENDWMTVNISKNRYQLGCDGQDTFVGYIHKSRISPIENIEIYKGNEFLFKYKLTKFNLENKVTDFDGKWLTRINGRHFYGTDGNIPKIEIAGIDVTINGKTIDIPEVFYEDLFECDNEVTINKNKDDYIVHQWNGDGAGGYLIVWVFGNEKLKQRFILIP